MNHMVSYDALYGAFHHIIGYSDQIKGQNKSKTGICGDQTPLIQGDSNDVLYSSDTLHLQVHYLSKQWQIWCLVCKTFQHNVYILPH